MSIAELASMVGLDEKEVSVILDKTIGCTAYVTPKYIALVDKILADAMTHRLDDVLVKLFIRTFSVCVFKICHDMDEDMARCMHVLMTRLLHIWKEQDSCLSHQGYVLLNDWQRYMKHEAALVPAEILNLDIFQEFDPQHEPKVTYSEDYHHDLDETTYIKRVATPDAVFLFRKQLRRLICDAWDKGFPLLSFDRIVDFCHTNCEERYELAELKALKARECEAHAAVSAN